MLNKKTHQKKDRSFRYVPTPKSKASSFSREADERF